MKPSVNSIRVLSDGSDYKLSEYLGRIGFDSVDFIPEVRLESICSHADDSYCSLTLILLSSEIFMRLECISMEDRDELIVKHIEDLAISVVSQLESYENRVRKKGGEIIFPFVPTLFSRKETESWQNTSKSSHRFAIRMLNSEIAKRIDSSRAITLVDGIGEISDRCKKLWFRLGSCWDEENSQMLTSQVSAHMNLAESNKKMIILDLDNTLWGGILSEDTKDGIELGQDTVRGKIYQEVHRLLIGLSRQGFLLSICSKNNRDEALRCLFDHHGSLFTRNSIVGARINWDSKAENIKSLVEEIGIGLDSCVFIDDSMVECSEVEERCPGVNAICIPRNIYSYPSILRHSALLHRKKPSVEDLNRTKTYIQDEQRRSTALSLDSSGMSRDEWLVTLHMKLVLKRLDTEDRAIDRIVQLFSRANQFNLCYSKYTHSQMIELLSEDELEVLYASLSDRFGSDGIIACIVIRGCRLRREMTVLDFVQSCRVFGRGVEESFLSAVLRRSSWAENIRFRVRPNSRNAASTKFVTSVTGGVNFNATIKRTLVLDQIRREHVEWQWA